MFHLGLTNNNGNRQYQIQDYKQME